MKEKVKLFLKAKGFILFWCVCLTMSSWYTMFHHYARFGYSSDLVGEVENKFLDFRFKIRGPIQPKSNIKILAIDEKTIKTFGAWPFSRKYYGQAIDHLKKAGVKVIGMDAVFDVPEVSSINDVADSILKLDTINKKEISKILNPKNTAPGDLIFSKSVQDFENVVLGYFYFQSKQEVIEGGREKDAYASLDEMSSSAIEAIVMPDGKELKDYLESMKAYGIVSNHSILNSSSGHFGFFSNESDNDAIARWVTLVKIIDNKLMPSLSLKMASLALNRDILVIFDQFGIESLELVSQEDPSDSIKIPLDPLGAGKLLVNQLGPRATFKHVSLADAYNDTFSKEEREGLKDSVMLLGMTAIGINDQRPNSFDAQLDGVENHAAALDNILSKSFISRPKSIFAMELLTLLLIGLFLVPILLFTRATLAGGIVTATFFGFYYVDKYYLFNRGTWAYMGMPFLLIAALFIMVTLYRYITEEKERKKVKGAFAHYLSPEVISQVLNNPDSLQLGGVRKELTVFFSDVRSFTTISESLTPEQLCEYMNTYFTPMTEIILKSGGVLDKYIGDAIMAFWGAPIAINDQADRAAHSAIAMLYALDKLDAVFLSKKYPQCRIGIGLNTGLMSVGNMGSGERFCYTVMGDAVNLGARLEGLTKEYGIQIMVAEFTIAALKNKNQFFYRDLDDIRVKGKNEPVKVYELMRPDILPTHDQIRKLIKIFEDARKYYVLQNWDLSLQKFNECLELRPTDGPSKLYIERIEEFRQNAPGEKWDGVYNFTHK